MDFDKAKLEAVCKAHGIDLVVVFGSASKGSVRPTSDLDLAVHLEHCGAEYDLLGMIADFDEVFRRQIDLVVLNRVSSDTLRHEVFKYGRPFYDQTGAS